MFLQGKIDGPPNYKALKTAEERRAVRYKISQLHQMGTSPFASLFVASDEASYIIATTIVIDGGVTTTCRRI